MNLTPSDLEEFRTMLVGRARSLRYLWEWPPQVEVEDVVSTTIAKAWQRIDQFRGVTRGEIASWLLSILNHEIVDALRQAGAAKRGGGRVYSFDEFISQSESRLERMFVADISSPSTRAQRDELLLAAYTAIELLPERQRMALLARFIGQWSISQIADELNRLRFESRDLSSADDPPVTEKAVTSLIERALRKLRDLLEHLE